MEGREGGMKGWRREGEEERKGKGRREDGGSHRITGGTKKEG